MTQAEPVDIQRAALGLVKRWEHAPELFFREALCVDPWQKQIEIAQSVDQHDRTAVRSSQKIGKSAIASWIAAWWAFTRKGGQVVLTAPAAHQVENILWPEFRRALLPDPANPLKPRLIEPDWLAIDPRTGLRLPGERRVFCVTTNEPEKLQGLSGKNLLIIVDEGSGYPQELWAPLIGNMAGGAHMLTTGNPTQTSGEFYDAFHEKSEFWNGFHVSAYDTPNVIAGYEVIPGLASREWCEARKKEWGEESAEYQVRVLGNFPSQGASSIVSLLSYELSVKQWAATMALEGPLELGVDVARYGDDESVIAARIRRRAWIDDRMNGFDGNEVARRVATSIKSNRCAGQPVRVKVDGIGYGAAVVDALNSMNARGALGDNVLVYDINVANVADDEEKYHALRDQFWFMTSEWLKEGGVFKHDPKTKSELLGARYAFDERGRRKVESKKEMKKRIGRSPDGADALSLAIYAAPEPDFVVGGVTKRARFQGGGTRGHRL